MPDIYLIDTAKKVVLSVLLASILGLERQRHGRIAGLRTHILVSLASCILMAISLELKGYAESGGLYYIDPLRLAAGIMTGMGFIGAGTIIRAGTTHVRGVTTAAGLWLNSAIGISVGLGNYYIAIITTAVCFFVLLGNIDRFIPSESFIVLGVTISAMTGALDKIKKVCADNGAVFIDADISKNKPDNKISYKIHLKFSRKVTGEDILDALMKIEEIESARYEYC